MFLKMNKRHQAHKPVNKCNNYLGPIFELKWSKRPNCVSMPNFVAIGPTVAEIWRFCDFSAVEEGRTVLPCHISSKSVKPRPRYNVGLCSFVRSFVRSFRAGAQPTLDSSVYAVRRPSALAPGREEGNWLVCAMCARRAGEVG